MDRLALACAAEIVLQARVGSKRYPGKMLADIAGKTLLERVLIRLETAYRPGILAIPDDKANEPLAVIARNRGWRIFCGSESDVLGRYACAVREYGLTKVIRATGDNPLVDPAAVCGVAEALEKFDCVGTRGFSAGASVEGASATALFEAEQDATDPYDREHVMPFLYKHPERFTRYFVEPIGPARHHRLTVDTQEDIDFMRAVFSALGDKPLLSEVFSFIDGGSKRS